MKIRSPSKKPIKHGEKQKEREREGERSNSVFDFLIAIRHRSSFVNVVSLNKVEQQKLALRALYQFHKLRFQYHFNNISMWFADLLYFFFFAESIIFTGIC